MFELKTYSFSELKELFHVSASRTQEITRKLDRYGIAYKMNGTRAPNITFEITALPDPFKLHCITKLNMSAQTDFKKLRNLYFYFFSDVDFANYTYSQMEAIMADECGENETFSRGTISQKIRFLDTLGYIFISPFDFIYYSIEKGRNGEKIYTEIPREQYAAGWKLYFDNKREYGTDVAYSMMRDEIGGHPYKKPIIYTNVFYLKEIEELIEAINQSFMCKSDY